MYNFNINFSSLSSDVLIHLTQWQYWWWFWFSLVWVFYFLIGLRVSRFRVLKMRPKISTGFRPHGKWGDFLACTIPLLWCINILTNSNLILRLIEWQNESSLFTVRVRARQWYWIYKFELKNFTDILSTPKNIGNNKWLVNTFGELQVANDYLHILQLRSQNKWIKDFWNNSLKDYSKTSKNHIVSPKEQLRVNLLNDYNNIIDSEKKELLYKNLFKQSSYDSNTTFKDVLIDYKPINDYTPLDICIRPYHSYYGWDQYKDRANSYNHDYYSLISPFFLDLSRTVKKVKTPNSDLIKFEDFDEYSRFFKKNYAGKLPLRLIKLPLRYENGESFYKLRFNSNSNIIEHKALQDTIYFTLKQKRYNRKKEVSPIVYLDQNDKIKDKSYLYLLNSKDLIKKANINNTIQYNLVGKNKKRNEIFSIHSNKRLLRTKKILVLPAHVNITIITNSYDIVHSWFIPGLGLKLDCVPGRSTHHTFFIDNVGFYYGQCAEICGRYHHHMPIKLCALPFEHFLLWWNNFGLPRLFNTFSKRTNTLYETRKYTW